MTKIIQKSATFLLAVTLAAILVPSVFAHQGSHGINIHQHNRMIKKRISTSGGDVRKRSPDKKKPDVPLLTLTSPGNPTSTDSSGGNTNTPTSAPSSTTTTSTSTVSTPSSTSIPSTSTSSTSTSQTSTTTSSSTTSTTSSTTSSTSSSTSSSTTTSTTQAPSTTQGMSTAVVFISGSSTTTTSQSPTMTAIGAAKSMTVAKRTVIVLVAIAGSIGVTFVIWTVIRKWKFRPSREFEDRLNGNIDWTPSAFDDPMAEKIAAHRRNPSAGSHGSFGSSDLHNNGARATGQPDLKRSGSGRSNQIETNIPDLPPHDLLPHHDYAPGPIHSDAPGPVYNEMSRSPPGMSRLDGAGNSGLSRSATVSYGEDPYGGYTEYDDHPHGAANVAPHHAFGAAPAAQPPQPGYGVQYRGY